MRTTSSSDSRRAVIDPGLRWLTILDEGGSRPSGRLGEDHEIAGYDVDGGVATITTTTGRVFEVALVGGDLWARDVTKT